MGKIELLGYKISRLELLNELEESGEVSPYGIFCQF